ncbi:hypothetical protein [Nocardia thailandica]|uniref:hypothetical protein n=1 Tax=Nocardia thailandica TaxID=257275 RepID=UPI0005BDDB91|nr:hypothetical protein [Nocardia thailandica]
MAATAAVRQHLLAQSGYPGRPDPVADEQLHRNMNALRTRITTTAEAIGMKPAQFRRATTITDADLAQRVQALSVQNPDDVEVRWRDYTSPHIAASVRSSLANLRRTANASCRLPEPTPFDPATLLRRAQEALALLSPTSGTAPGAEIEHAVVAALPEPFLHQETEGAVLNQSLDDLLAAPSNGHDLVADL